MQDERSEETNDNSDEQKAHEKLKLARSIIKEAVTNAGIKDISEYKGEPLTNRWHVFSANHGDDVVLRMYVQGIFGVINADVSILHAAGWAIDETELVLNRPDATELLDFTEEERPDLLHENARMIVEQFVRQVPIIFYPLISKALRQSIEAHVNNHVKTLLKDHWQALGKPKDFTLSPSTTFMDYAKKIDEEFEALMKGLLGNRRAWLTAERREHLDEEHEQLRASYQVAKDYYNQSRQAFFLGKRNRTVDEWNEEWMTNSLRIFPDLSYRCLSEINDYQPFELAHIHLGERYDYSPQYMAKLISDASGLKRRKNESKMKKSE
jgi:hypothetical protein